MMSGWAEIQVQPPSLIPLVSSLAHYLWLELNMSYEQAAALDTDSDTV